MDLPALLVWAICFRTVGGVGHKYPEAMAKHNTMTSAKKRRWAAEVLDFDLCVCRCKRSVWDTYGHSKL